MEVQGVAGSARARWSKRSLHGLAGLALFLVGAFVIFVQFGRFTMHAYRIPSSAMEPTLHCARPGIGCEGDVEDRVLVPRFLPMWTPSRGDVIVFETPPEARLRCGTGGTFVKRLIGLPGETVSERDGIISIDGRPLQEPYAPRYQRGTGSGRWRVPKGEYLLLGDNRSQSCDSRVFDSVPRRNLVGPLVARYSPLDRIGLL